jgi:hypothetical protein
LTGKELMDRLDKVIKKPAVKKGVNQESWRNRNTPEPVKQANSSTSSQGNLIGTLWKKVSGIGQTGNRESKMVETKKLKITKYHRKCYEILNF